jgi:large subunit ribosomal protein L9
MKQQYLLVEDVEGIGRSGEVISVKPGFARNYLCPQRKAVLATDHSLRMQTKLQEERAKKAAVDKEKAAKIAEKYNQLVLTINVKVDPEGHMYGSVGVADLLELFVQEGLELDRKHIELHKPIKEVGVHLMKLKLDEGVFCEYTLQVVGEPSASPRKE